MKYEPWQRERGQGASFFQQRLKQMPVHERIHTLVANKGFVAQALGKELGISTR